MSFHHSPKIVTNGLVGYWDAANTKSYPGSETIWYDLSGNNNDGTIYGATYINTNQQYFTFNAVNERIVLLTPFFVSPTSMTISGWFRMTGGVGTYRCILHKGTGTSVGASSFWIGVSGAGTLVATIGANNGIGWGGGDTGIAAILGDWYFMSAVWNGTTVRVFVNGNFNKSYSLTSYIEPTNPTRIGASGDTGSYQVIGDVSSIRMFYNIGLTDSQILQNFNTQKTKFGL